MPKKSTPTKPQKPRKVAAAPQRWPYEYEHTKFPDDEYDGDIVIDHVWARDAIFHGNAVILARYLREADEIDPRIRRELAEMLNPTSNHTWRLDPQYRFRGDPQNRRRTGKLLSPRSFCLLQSYSLRRTRLTPDVIERLQKCWIRNRIMNCGSTSSNERVADRLLNVRQNIGRSLCLLP